MRAKKGRYILKIEQMEVYYDRIMHIHHIDICVQFARFSYEILLRTSAMWWWQLLLHLSTFTSKGYAASFRKEGWSL